MEYFINISIITSVTAFVILVVRGLLKNKVSPKWLIVLWAMLAIRLLIPVFPESNLSIFNNVPRIETSEVEVSNDVKQFEKNLPNIDTEIDTYIKGNITTGHNNREITINKRFTDSITTIWIIGSFVLLLYMISVYFTYHLKTRKLDTVTEPDILDVLDECKQRLGIKAKITVRKGGETPLLKGLINPQIILPEGYVHEELKSVFIHELMHYKYKDVLWNIIGTLLLCVYWYNPIMWFSFFEFRKDIEILCDYRVLQVYKNKKDYASVLLKTALNKNRFIMATTSMQNGKKDISKRIKYIAYLKKPKVIWTIIGVAITIIIGVVCLTNPTGKPIETSNMVKDLDYKRIYGHKTLYVGDAGKVGNLTDNLYYAKYKNGFSLYTAAKPYAVNINYLVKSGDFDGTKLTDKMLKNAAIMFCLINNVDEINFKFDDGNKTYDFPFEREYFNGIFGEDIRNYSASFEKFRNKFIPMIEREFSANNKVEELLQVIMSSPKTSSNPDDYIKAHQDEYETILKMGDEALEYMLSLFEKGEGKGLKGHIMMSLCIDLLGDRNNVAEGLYTSPEEWYSKLLPYDAVKLPPFKYKSEDKIEQMVYSAALKQGHGKNNGKDDTSVTIVAPHIFGTYEKGNELKIFATIYDEQFKLYGKTFCSDGGGVIPVAIVYTKNDDGTYSLKEYIQAMDGSYFQKSIEEFCHPRKDIARAMLRHYGNYEDLFVLMRENIIYYLKANGLKGINLKQNDGTIVPLT